jgi:hypothetical protein
LFAEYSHLALNPSEIHAFDFKGEFLGFGICSVSPTIGIDWSIYETLWDGRRRQPRRKKTIGHDVMIQTARFKT